MTTWVIFQCHACKHTMEEKPEVCPQCGSNDLHVLMALGRGSQEAWLVTKEREAREKFVRWNAKVRKG